MNDNKCIRQQVDLEQINRCKEAVAALENTFEFSTGILELASNKVRMKLLFLLEQEQRLCVCDMSNVLDMTIPAISQHLKKLKEGNLVYTERQAQTIYYALNPVYRSALTSLFYLGTQNTEHTAYAG